MSKVTLKIGDKFSSVLSGIALSITGFTEAKINVSNGGYWDVPLMGNYYYVNGVRYAKEDIIIPTGEEFEPITKDNIAEVLEHNRISQDCFSLTKNWISYRWTSTNSCVVWSITLSFDNPKWLEHLEVEFGKLKPLPKKVNPFDVVQIGQWVRYIGEDAFETTKNRWYQRIPGGWFTYKIDNDSTVHTTEYEKWDLTDIRDYNPDEEIILKVGDVYINSHGDKYTIEAFDYVNNAVIVGSGCWRFNKFTLEAGIISVNGRQGKYVIPPFDFVQTLLDNGFKHLANTDVYVAGKHKIALIDKDTVYVLGHKINPTPENAKRLVDIAKILKELE